MKYILFFITLSLFTINTFSQDIFGRRKKDLVEFRVYKQGGWMFAPGITYTPGYVPKDDKRDLKQKGGLGLYAEIGRFQIFYEGGNFFNYLDYSLAFKRLKGAEEFNGNKAIFKQNFALANFNINNIWQIGDYKFIQNSLGLNLDYKFSDNYAPNGSDILAPNNTNNLLFSLHYKIGYGIKVKDNLFIIPALEFPILNAMQWENGKSTYGIFSSRYKPVILSVRFAFLRKRGSMACPDNTLSPADKKKQDMHMMGQ